MSVLIIVLGSPLFWFGLLAAFLSWAKWEEGKRQVALKRVLQGGPDG